MLFQPNYDTRYGFSNQNESNSANVSPINGNRNSNSKDQLFMSQNQLHTPQENTNDSSNNLYKASVYNQNGQEFHKGESHKRQSSNIHGHFTPSKSHNMNENSPLRGSKEGMYSGAPDLPPRVDRTAKPASLSKATSNRYLYMFFY